LNKNRPSYKFSHIIYFFAVSSKDALTYASACNKLFIMDDSIDRINTKINMQFITDNLNVERSNNLRTGKPENSFGNTNQLFENIVDTMEHIKILNDLLEMLVNNNAHPTVTLARALNWLHKHEINTPANRQAICRLAGRAQVLDNININWQFNLAERLQINESEKLFNQNMFDVITQVVALKADNTLEPPTADMQAVPMQRCF
jgi:hypothetical protein